MATNSVFSRTPYREPRTELLGHSQSSGWLIGPPTLKERVGAVMSPTARTKGAAAWVEPVALTIATPNKTNANKKLDSKQT